MKFYLETSEQVLNDLHSSAQGLTTAEAEERLTRNGKNKLQEAKRDSLVKKFFSSLMDPMILMLLGAAAIQAIVTVIESGGQPSFREFADVIVILSVVLLNTVLSLVQEGKAESAMDALKEMTAATSKVLRDGRQILLKSEDLVIGDVVVLEAGDAVPADCRILEGHSLKAEESALTGESVPVNKLMDTLRCGQGSDVPLGDRTNMLYSGSTVVYGRGRAVVTATGMDTEMGKIADALNQAKAEETPLQKKMAELSHLLTKLVLGICAIVFLVGVVEAMLLSGEPFSWSILGKTALNTFIAAIALAVAAIPEGLPAVVTIVLSIGVTSMAKRNAVIRRLTAVETLGCAQVICSDKTGTLTQNKMTVVEAWGADKALLARGMALCSDAELNASGQAEGEPTECALVNFAAGEGFPKDTLKADFPRVAEAPFDSMRKMMSTLHTCTQGVMQFTKGAPDEVLAHCTHVLTEQGICPMTNEDRQRIMTQNKSMADKALRVLACACREYAALPADTSDAALEQDLTFVGLTGMIDPVRPEVKAAVEECRQAGIRAIMITGDHIDTAVAIARELGLISDPSQAIMGQALNDMSDEELDRAIERYSVYARVQPEHKVRIVEAWKRRGKITAMTGDGVNDAPAVKEANIGVAMGKSGTDACKQAADIILLDDDFSTLCEAVRQGRTVYSNIRKFVRYLISCNIGEVMVMFLSIILGMPVILLPTQILLVNLVTDGLPAIALGMEKTEKAVMEMKPQRFSGDFFSGGLLHKIIIRGILIGICTLGCFAYSLMYIGTDLSTARTCALVTLIASQLIHVFECRSEYVSIFRMNPFKNLWLLLAVIVSAAVTALCIYLPQASIVMETIPLCPAEMAWSLIFAAAVPIVSGLLMLIFRKNRSKD